MAYAWVKQLLVQILVIVASIHENLVRDRDAPHCCCYYGCGRCYCYCIAAVSVTIAATAAATAVATAAVAVVMSSANAYTT